MANPFNQVQVRNVQGSTFDLSHDVKMSMTMGKLTPVLVQECLPGDKFNMQSETLIRFAPLVAPVMHTINVYTHYFFVPNRLVWSNWEKFITANNGGIPPAPPIMKGLNAAPGSLSDYMGIPTGVAIDEISALPFAAYQKIYNEYYRDENLAPIIPCDLIDGDNSAFWQNLVDIRTRAWEHDYFTSALPFAQKGAAVTLPLNGQADVVYSTSGALKGQFRSNDSTILPAATAAMNLAAPGTTDGAQPRTLAGKAVSYDPGQTLKVDLTTASASTINDLRRAFKLQEWLEKMARGGSRYVEQTLMHFGIKSSDARLNRPEYIGGQKSPVVISEVLQTSDTGGEDTPLATMGGHALSASSGKNAKYTCEEHGYIIGIMSIMPNTAYQQGLPKHFSRKSHLDYAWPTFANIGEQEVLNKELYYKSADMAYNNQTFGYLPRYSEYRYQPNRVAGEFRTTLNYWHLGRNFSTPPQLNQAFIECVPRTDIFAVSGGAATQNIWCHVRNRVTAFRKLPKYGTPTM